MRAFNATLGGCLGVAFAGGLAGGLIVLGCVVLYAVVTALAR